MRPQLRAETLRMKDVSSERREAMRALMHRIYADVDDVAFERDLAAKQWIILLLDRAHGGVAGFSTIGLEEVTFRGAPAEVLFSGDTVIDPAYWGQKVLDAAFARFLVRRKLRRPWRPFFWLLLSAGFKTYLLIINYFPGAFPRHDREADPEEAAFLKAYSRERFGTAYDAAQGIVRLPGNYRVREGVAPITEAELRRPDIAYFASRNPGHLNGDELVCLAQVHLKDLFAAFLRIARKRRPKPVAASPAQHGQGG